MLKVVEARIAAGKVFHNRGAALAKDLVPKVCNQLRDTISSSKSLDRSDRVGRYQDRRSTTYWGARPCKRSGGRSRHYLGEHFHATSKKRLPREWMVFSNPSTHAKENILVMYSRWSAKLTKCIPYLLPTLSHHPILLSSTINIREGGKPSTIHTVEGCPFPAPSWDTFFHQHRRRPG